MFDAILRAAHQLPELKPITPSPESVQELPFSESAKALREVHKSILEKKKVPEYQIQIKPEVIRQIEESLRTTFPKSRDTACQKRTL